MILVKDSSSIESSRLFQYLVSVEPGVVISSVTPNTIDNFEDRKIPDIPHLPDPSFVETFDHNRNEGNWSFFGNPDNKIEIIDRDGGNPGAFLHARCQYPFGRYSDLLHRNQDDPAAHQSV